MTRKQQYVFADFYVAEVPNYFIFLGAYGPLGESAISASDSWYLTCTGHGSVLPMVEFYTDYVLQVLEKTRTDNIKRLSVKKKVSEDFTRYADEYLKRTAWSG